MSVGYLLGRVAVSLLFLPHYFRGEMFTAYELMRRRFGERIRRLTAAIFLVTRALAEGVRVFAISLVISIVLGTGETSLHRPDRLLDAVLHIRGRHDRGDLDRRGADEPVRARRGRQPLRDSGEDPRRLDARRGSGRRDAGKLQVFDFRFSPTMEFFSRKYSFWAGLVGGCFLTTASHGTDQLMVQRLLSARNEAQSRAALLASWVVIFFQFTLFLLIGVLLFVYYRDAHLVAPRDVGPHLSGVRVAPSAGGRGRLGDGGDSGGRHGQPERGAEFAGVHHGDRFRALVAGGPVPHRGARPSNWRAV